MPVLARAGSVVPLDDGWADPDGPCALDGDGDLGALAGAGAPALTLDHAPRLLAFHGWPDAEGTAEGVCVDDAGDGDGPTRRDTVRLEGALPGGTATWSWERTGDFAAPPVVRVVVPGLAARRAEADGVEVPVSGGVVVCPPFTVLTMEGLHPTVPHRP
jgi:hypothetical protein